MSDKCWLYIISYEKYCLTFGKFNESDKKNIAFNGLI